MANYPEFLVLRTAVLRTADGAEHLIRYGPAISIALPAEPPPLRPTPAAASHRYQLALALRELARRREPIRTLLADRTSCDGTIQAVGSDYLEIAEHHLGEARAGERSGHGGSSGSPRLLRSAFLGRADERVLARPVGRLLVHPLDVGLELEAVDPPYATPAEFDRGKLATADQRIDLGDPDVEDRGHVLQGVEPGLDAGRGHEVLLVALLSRIPILCLGACERSSLSYPQ
jgi:hypothetical protein